MAHHQRVRVQLLLWAGPMKVLAKTGLDASTVLEKLLQRGDNDKSIQKHV